MQTKDIKVGTHYAVPEYETWGDLKKAEVLETGVRMEPTRGFGRYGRQKAMSNGVRVQFKTGDHKGETVVVEPKQVKRPWAEHAAEQRQIKEWRKQAEQREAEQRQQRAEYAFSLHQALVAKGAKVGIDYCYLDENYDALQAAGFKPATEVDFGSRAHFHSALNGLSTLMEKGTVNLDQVAFLLDLTTEVPQPEDSLDSYDLDDEDAPIEQHPFPRPGDDDEDED